MSRDPIRPGGALEGRLFRSLLERLADQREPSAGERIGPWEIVRELGRGGTGVVYLARRADGAFHHEVALKWLRGDRPVPGGKAVLARERELLASLDHPHIARLIDGGQTEDGLLWFVMDLVSGHTIDQHAGRLALHDRLRLLSALCKAVQHAHRRGLIHGDIKPSNVLVDDRGEPRLLDFGIARIKGLGGSGSYGLTPDYASPEQKRREELTTASDIWQLGRLLEELVGADARAADLRAIVARARAAEPEDRYASAAALAADVDAWMSRRPVLAYSGGVPYRTWRWVQRNTGVSVVAATAVLVIVVGGAWMTWQLADERNLARVEAARAEAALSESQEALERAEALREFMVDLFRAGRPIRPRDELPTTAEILERGARRALDPDSASANERFGMLVTLAEVYQSQSLYEPAGELADAAMELAETLTSVAPEDHARALEITSRVEISGGGSLDTAEAYLLEAEGLLEGVDGAWNRLAQTRITRTWVERHRGDHARALDLVEPLYEEMHLAGRLNPGTSAALLITLGGLYSAQGDLDNAARFMGEGLEAYRQDAGEDSRMYLISLASSAGLERSLGRLDEAERRAREAIQGYDRIDSEPLDYRGAVRTTLARTLLDAGREQEAFDQLRRAGEEFAGFRGMAPEQWPPYYSLRGSFHARLGRLDDARADLDHARELIDQDGGFDPPLIAAVDVLRAWVICLAGAGLDGQNLLDSIEQPELLMGRARNRAQLHEARAACHFARENYSQGLKEIRLSLEAQDAPGLVAKSIDRRLLKARLLDGLERPEDAKQELLTVDQQLASLGLEGHPRRMIVSDALGGLKSTLD